MYPNNVITLQSLQQGLQNLKVLVIGDLMLDRYLYGHVNRISPEAPVPVVQIEGKEDRLGGAANVALNCKTLGADVFLAGIIGNDDAGKCLVSLIEQHGIHAQLILTDNERPTTIKTRVISRHQQLFRLDEEKEQNLSLSLEHQFIDLLLKFIQIEKPDVVIFEDYDKGALNENIIDKVMNHCKHVGCVTAVDPKYKNFHFYKSATIFKPNLKEVVEAYKLHYTKNPLEVLEESALRIQNELAPKVILITLSELGIFVQEGKQKKILPANKRNIADVSGAGDTVVATAALVYAITGSSLLAAQLSNLAGGMVCEYPGVVPIHLEDWLKEAQAFLESVPNDHNQ